MQDNISQFIKDFCESFVFIEDADDVEEPTGPFDEGQCAIIAQALIWVFRDELREFVLEPLRQLDPPLQGQFADQRTDLQREVDAFIQQQFLDQARLIDCTLRNLMKQHADLQINGLAGLLAEGYVRLAHAQPKIDDPAVQAVVDAMYTESLGISKPEAIRRMVEITAQRFPEINNEILLEYGTRMQAREVEQGITRETRIRR